MSNQLDPLFYLYFLDKNDFIQSVLSIFFNPKLITCIKNIENEKTKKNSIPKTNEIKFSLNSLQIDLNLLNSFLNFSNIPYKLLEMDIPKIELTYQKDSKWEIKIDSLKLKILEIKISNNDLQKEKTPEEHQFILIQELKQHYSQYFKEIKYIFTNISFHLIFEEESIQKEIFIDNLPIEITRKLNLIKIHEKQNSKTKNKKRSIPKENIIKEFFKTIITIHFFFQKKQKNNLLIQYKINGSQNYNQLCSFKLQEMKLFHGFDHNLQENQNPNDFKQNENKIICKNFVYLKFQELIFQQPKIENLHPLLNLLQIISNFFFSNPFIFTSIPFQKKNPNEKQIENIRKSLENDSNEDPNQLFTKTIGEIKKIFKFQNNPFNFKTKTSFPFENVATFLITSIKKFSVQFPFINNNFENNDQIFRYKFGSFIKRIAFISKTKNFTDLSFKRFALYQKENKERKEILSFENTNSNSLITANLFTNDNLMEIFIYEFSRINIDIEDQDINKMINAFIFCMQEIIYNWNNTSKITQIQIESKSIEKVGIRINNNADFCDNNFQDLTLSTQNIFEEINFAFKNYFFFLKNNINSIMIEKKPVLVQGNDKGNPNPSIQIIFHYPKIGIEHKQMVRFLLTESQDEKKEFERHDLAGDYYTFSQNSSDEKSINENKVEIEQNSNVIFKIFIPIIRISNYKFNTLQNWIKNIYQKLFDSPQKTYAFFFQINELYFSLKDSIFTISNQDSLTQEINNNLKTKTDEKEKNTQNNIFSFEFENISAVIAKNLMKNNIDYLSLQIENLQLIHKTIHSHNKTDNKDSLFVTGQSFFHVYNKNDIDFFKLISKKEKDPKIIQDQDINENIQNTEQNTDISIQNQYPKMLSLIYFNNRSSYTKKKCNQEIVLDFHLKDFNFKFTCPLVISNLLDYLKPMFQSQEPAQKNARKSYYFSGENVLLKFDASSSIQKSIIWDLSKFSVKNEPKFNSKLFSFQFQDVNIFLVNEKNVKNEKNEQNKPSQTKIGFSKNFGVIINLNENPNENENENENETIHTLDYIFNQNLLQLNFTSSSYLSLLEILDTFKKLFNFPKNKATNSFSGDSHQFNIINYNQPTLPNQKLGEEVEYPIIKWFLDNGDDEKKLKIKKNYLIQEQKLKKGIFDCKSRILSIEISTNLMINLNVSSDNPNNEFDTKMIFHFELFNFYFELFPRNQLGRFRINFSAKNLQFYNFLQQEKMNNEETKTESENSTPKNEKKTNSYFKLFPKFKSTPKSKSDSNLNSNSDIIDLATFLCTEGISDDDLNPIIDAHLDYVIPYPNIFEFRFYFRILRLNLKIDENSFIFLNQFFSPSKNANLDEIRPFFQRLEVKSFPAKIMFLNTKFFNFTFDTNCNTFQFPEIIDNGIDGWYNIFDKILKLYKKSLSKEKIHGLPVINFFWDSANKINNIWNETRLKIQKSSSYQNLVQDVIVTISQETVKTSKKGKKKAQKILFSDN